MKEDTESAPFHITNLMSDEGAELQENEFLQHCTLTRITETEDRKSGYGLRTDEITGFGIRREFLKNGVVPYFLMCAESLELKEPNATRKVWTSAIIEIIDMGQNTIEFKTESGSHYRVQYSNRSH